MDELPDFLEAANAHVAEDPSGFFEYEYVHLWKWKMETRNISTRPYAIHRRRLLNSKRRLHFVCRIRSHKEVGPLVVTVTVLANVTKLANAPTKLGHWRGSNVLYDTHCLTTTVSHRHRESKCSIAERTTLSFQTSWRGSRDSQGDGCGRELGADCMALLVVYWSYRTSAKNAGM